MSRGRLARVRLQPVPSAGPSQAPLLFSSSAPSVRLLLRAFSGEWNERQYSLKAVHPVALPAHFVSTGAVTARSKLSRKQGAAMIMERCACFLRGEWLSLYVNAKSEVNRANMRLGNRERTGDLGGAGRQHRLLERVHEEARKLLSSDIDLENLSRPLADEDGGLVTLAWKVRLLMTRMQDV